MPNESPLDDTTACPLGARCAVCGSTDRLRPTAYDGELGVWCCTVCADCVVGGQRPRLAPGFEKLAIVAHCDHLGIPADEMVRRHHEEAEHDQFVRNPWAIRYIDRPVDEIVAACKERAAEIVDLKPPPSPEKLRRRYEGLASARTAGMWRRLAEGSYTERKRRRERTPEEWRQTFEGSDHTPDPNKGA